MRLLALLLALADCVFAAQLRTQVIDPSRNAISGAKIVVFDLRSRVLSEGATNATGHFTLFLSPGRYLLRVSHPGFQDRTLTVEMGQSNQAITVTMNLKTQTYSVTVSDAAGPLDTPTESHQDSLKLGPEDLENLPIKDGDVLSALTFFTNPAGGQSPTLIVDGMERTDAVALTPAQILQVRINNNEYSAEFPKPGKGRIEVDTRGGNDVLHGDFFFRARNSVFDARNAFAPANPPFSRYGYEFDISGPVIKKKIYFFLSADREDQQQVQPVLAYVPAGVLNEEALAPFTRDIATGRIDWQITDQHRASAKYEFHLDHFAGVGVGGLVLPEAGSTRFHRDYRIELSDQYVFSPTVLNSFRLALGTNYEQVRAETNAPSVIVNGAFQSGGAQLDDWRKEPRYEFRDTLGVQQHSLTWKAGVEANYHPFQSFSADDYGGIYQFASLTAYEAGQPLVYTVNSGNPLVVSEQDDYAWFLQAEKQWPRFTLFAGVRHEFQTHFSHYGNLAPRLAAAWALDQNRRTILRVGEGIFYDRRPPVILQQAIRFNGQNTLQYIVENPPFMNGRINAIGGLQPSTRYTIDPSMTFPRIYQTSATLERQLPAGFAATTDFTYQRGTHLFLTRNINAPLPVLGIRPNPEEGNVDQIESSASSHGSILNITVKSPPKKRYQIFAQYTFSYLRDNTNDVFGPPPPGGLPPGVSGNSTFALPADNYNLHPEWGPSNNDIRHRFGLSGTLQLPWRFTLGALASLHSGLPYDITTGYDNNHDTDPNDRPPGVTRNTGRGAGFFSLDVHLARAFAFQLESRKIEFEFAADSFNLLNHTNPSNYVGVESSPLFGLPNAAYNGREFQFSVHVHF